MSRSTPPCRWFLSRARRALLLALLPLAAGLAGCGGKGSAGSDSVTFTADVAANGTVDLYLSDLEGDVVRRISGPVVAGAEVTGFGWSPDRTLLWFVADRETDGLYELYLAHPGNPNDVPVNLSGPGPDGAIGSVYGASGSGGPAWSPDGTRIAYTAAHPPGGNALYVVNVTALPPAPKRVSPIPVVNGFVQSFGWSPDGSRIAFGGDPLKDEQRQLWTANPDGSDLVQVSVPAPGVTTDDVLGWSWAPDGSRLAYLHDPAGGQLSKLWTCLPDGSGLVERSALPAGRRVTSLAWAPTSSHIAYVSDQDTLGEFELFAAPAVGGSPFVLGPALGAYEVGNWLSWAPDGQKIAYFLSDQATLTSQLRLAYLTGLPPKLLDASPSPGDFPDPPVVWSPDGSRIAYSFTWNNPFSVDLKVVSAFSGQPETVGPAAQDEYVGSFRWSPDGTRIAYVMSQPLVGGNLFVVPASGGPAKQVSDVPASMNQVSAVYGFQWTEDSRRVVYLGGDGASPLNPAPLRLWVAEPFGLFDVPRDLTPDPTGNGMVWDFGT